MSNTASKQSSYFQPPNKKSLSASSRHQVQCCGFSASVACPMWDDQACVAGPCIRVPANRQIASEKPPGSWCQCWTGNECPHRTFGAPQREVGPRHGDGKNEEVGRKGEGDGESMCCQQWAGEKGFLCTGRSLNSRHHPPSPKERMGRNCTGHLTGYLEMWGFFPWILLSCVPVATFAKSFSTLALGN